MFTISKYRFLLFFIFLVNSTTISSQVSYVTQIQSPETGYNKFGYLSSDGHGNLGLSNFTLLGGYLGIMSLNETGNIQHAIRLFNLDTSLHNNFTGLDIYNYKYDNQCHIASIAHPYPVTGSIPSEFYTALFHYNEQSTNYWAKTTYPKKQYYSAFSINNQNQIYCAHRSWNTFSNDFSSIGIALLDKMTANELWTHRYQPHDLSTLMFLQAEAISYANDNLYIAVRESGNNQNYYHLLKMDNNGQLIKTVKTELPSINYSFQIKNLYNDEMGNVYLGAVRRLNTEIVNQGIYGFF